MIKIEYGTTDATHTMVRNWINTNKIYNPNFKSIDIGGAMIGWTRDLVDMIVDFNVPDSANSMHMDINDESNWDRLLALVEKQGKFDYAISTHTLEDLHNPIVALKMLPKIAKCGIITTPSLRTELSNIESPEWLGYMHHRWIFEQDDGKILLIPKLVFLASVVKPAFQMSVSEFEIRYHWNDEIPYKIFMNGFLGPNSAVVINQYKELVNKYR